MGEGTGGSVAELGATEVEADVGVGDDGALEGVGDEGPVVTLPVVLGRTSPVVEPGVGEGVDVGGAVGLWVPVGVGDAVRAVVAGSSGASVEGPGDGVLEAGGCAVAVRVAAGVRVGVGVQVAVMGTGRVAEMGPWTSMCPESSITSRR